MIRRTMDAAFLNEVANHPEVRPWLGEVDKGPVELTEVLANPANIALVTEGGGWIFQPRMASIYEVHTLFLPEGRGRRFMAACREGFRYMFARTDALDIITKCPDDNAGARMASSVLGFKERFRRENAWAPSVGISYRGFSIDDWLSRDEACLERGRSFHAEMATAKEALGHPEPQHPADDAHDRAVGAAALMIEAANTAKAVGVYNRFAIFAGYATISASSATVIDLVDAVVEVRDGQMGILLCRPPPLSEPLAASPGPE